MCPSLNWLTRWEGVGCKNFSLEQILKMTFIVYGNSCKFVINHIVQFFFFFNESGFSNTDVWFYLFILRSGRVAIRGNLSVFHGFGDFVWWIIRACLKLENLRLWAFYSVKQVDGVGYFHQGVWAWSYVDIGKYPFEIFIWVVTGEVDDVSGLSGVSAWNGSFFRQFDN